MQVIAFTTPARPNWRWRIIDYGGDMIEESSQVFSTIAVAIAEGTRRLDAINAIRPSLRR
ncbi:MAG: hypothetical protein ACREM3_16810 [Candidatus Rokuibacteriota bacterium]